MDKQTQPRIWKGRIWRTGSTIDGEGFRFKAPIGAYADASAQLARAAAAGTIVRFAMGPVPVSELRTWTKTDRDELVRFEEALERLGVGA